MNPSLTFRVVMFRRGHVENLFRDNFMAAIHLILSGTNNAG